MSGAVFKVHRCGEELCVEIVDERGNEVDVKLEDILSLVWALMRQGYVGCDLRVEDWSGYDYCCIGLGRAGRDG